MSMPIGSVATVFQGRRVLVTGHTGFKGSWLALWLTRLGAEVTGLSLDPPTEPSNFGASRVAEVLSRDVRGDIRDAPRVAAVVSEAEPDIVFHLAAQPIVTAGLKNPRETIEVNVVGTASVLDAVRATRRPCAVVVVTSDKCYRNTGEMWGLRESDPLGGNDPYSASKAGTELVVDAYRASFFPLHNISEHGVRIATVRAGNVIGGGDWANDRILPDAARALSAGRDLVVRNPASVRPWQHVLEALSGYLAIGAELLGSGMTEHWSGAWNFGPLLGDESTVGELATAFVDAWGSGRWVSAPSGQRSVEAVQLRIAIDKCVRVLGWVPRWRAKEAVARTARWYRRFYDDPDASMYGACAEDIEAYERAVHPAGE